MTKLKVCLMCAVGGHLDEMFQIVDAFNEHHVFFVIYVVKFSRTAKGYKTYFINNRYDGMTIGSIFIETIISFWTYLKILIKEKPDVVVTTGSEFAIVPCYLSKLLGKKLICIESLCRINELSGTGKFLYPISDLFLVQWKPLTEKYKKAQFWGRVI